jgi:hypothetical protein
MGVLLIVGTIPGFFSGFFGFDEFPNRRRTESPGRNAVAAYRGESALAKPARSVLRVKGFCKNATGRSPRSRSRTSWLL